MDSNQIHRDRRLVPGAGEEGLRGGCLPGLEFQIYKMKSVLEAGCTAVGTHGRDQTVRLDG